MTDFILRHGNDLLAVECLKGFDVSFSTYCIYTCARDSLTFELHAVRILHSK